MVFRSLYQLHDRLVDEEDYEVAPLGRSHQKISAVVVIEPDGSLVDIQDARSGSSGRLVPRRVLVLGQTKPSGQGINPCFLWDNLGYLLGWDPRPGKSERAEATLAGSAERHLSVEREINIPSFSAVCRFLERWSSARAPEFPILAELQTGFAVFQIRGNASFVHNDPSIRAWWDRRTNGDPARMSAWWEDRCDVDHESNSLGQCLVTGDEAPIARLQPKIKGVAGSQPAGATIAGFNDEAYCSFGLDQSFNAPVSIEASRRYTTALNILLDGPKRDKHRILVGGTTIAFWTDRPSAAEDVFAIFATEGSAAPAAAEDQVLRAKLESLLKALREGREAFGDLADDPDHTEFFILGLATPTPARVAVRFFHRGSVASLLGNLRRHHGDIGIQRRFGEGSKRPEPELPSARYLLDETCPWKLGAQGERKAPSRDHIPPLLPGALLESIVTGYRYPDALFTAVMRRIVADRIVNYARASVIKGILVRNHSKEIPVSLDTSRTDPAYRIGRLFAAIEKTQADALGGQVNATVRDRFYSSASATPGVVFPRLLRTYQHHLAKLDGGLKVNREKLVQEILDPLSGFPSHLGLTDQGLFALGYYHQTNDFYRSKNNQTDANEA